MMRYFSIGLAMLLLGVLSACTGRNMQAQQTHANKTAEQLAAFPGAEGFGKFTTGGRGGKIMIVSKLDDAGPGSFRDALKSNNPRTIVFAVSGTIHLTTPLVITSNVTIAGQTAPGDGICIADQPVQMKGNNIIIRFLRFRMGDRFQKNVQVDGNGGDDAFSGTRNKQVIIDHCSMSWSTDEVCSVYAGDSTTLQWNFIYEPLNYSYHFEAGDKDFEQHGYGSILGGAHMSFHHNLFAHCVSRTPRFDGQRNIPSEFVDFRNNVIYNWGSNNVYAGEAGSYNLINNYYRYGPSTLPTVRNRLLNPYKRSDLPFGKFFLDGNYVDGDPETSADNWKGVVMHEGAAADAAQSRTTKAFPAEPIQTQPAAAAYEKVLKEGGASLPIRDTLDERIVNDVRNRTGRIIDVQGGYAHGTPYNISVSAWPYLESVTALPDSDKDGMPDQYEKENRLNPADPADAVQHQQPGGYTNIEVYINSLVKP